MYSNSSHRSVGHAKSKSAVSRPRMFLLKVIKTKTPEMHAITAIIELIMGMTINDIGARLKIQNENFILCLISKFKDCSKSFEQYKTITLEHHIQPQRLDAQDDLSHRQL